MIGRGFTFTFKRGWSMAVRPEGMPWLTPFLTVRDAAKALAFYEAAFGFSRRDVFTDDAGVVTHGEVTWHDASVMFSPEDPTGASPARAPVTLGIASPVALYVYCDDVDALVSRATDAGAGVLMPPVDMPWGDRMASLTDPDGHTWNFATHLGGASGG
jgi:uncharacterized glyoxalase superfamily protein PhnB